MGNFEIGEALVSNLKSKLVNKAMGTVVKGMVTHEPA